MFSVALSGAVGGLQCLRGPFIAGFKAGKRGQCRKRRWTDGRDGEKKRNERETELEIVCLSRNAGCTPHNRFRASTHCCSLCYVPVLI